MKNNKICKLTPSIYAADLLNLNKELKFLQENNVTSLHFDVMDGSFVPVISIGQLLFEKIKANYNFNIDIHLMGNNILNFVQNIDLSMVEYMTIHLEANDFKDAFEFLKKQNVKIGIAINPDTDVNKIKKYLNDIDLVLPMSVVPGKSGQKFIDISSKIKKIRDYGFKKDIQVDGGINNETLPICKSAGANLFVIGSYLFNNHNNIKIIDNLLQK